MISKKTVQTSDIKNGVKLFQYLEELSLLNLNIRSSIKNLTPDEDFFDIENTNFIPNLEKVFLKNRNLDNSDEDLLMSIERCEIEKMPKPPKELTEWVDISIKGFEKPELKKYIIVTEKFNESEERIALTDQISELMKVPKILEDWVTKDNRFGKAKYKIISERDSKIYLKDRPELESLYENWIENKWIIWKDKNYNYLLTNIAYDKFYSLRSFLKSEIDNFDLLWAHDIFTWKKNNIDIYHPTLFSPTILDFDSEKNIISLKRDRNKKIIFDVAFIRESLDESNKNLVDIDELSEKINGDADFDVWDKDLLDRYLGSLTRLISPDGISKYNKIEVVEIESNPTIYNYHGIFLLKKNGKSWAEYAKKIQEDIKENNTLTPFLNDLISVKAVDSEIVEETFIEENSDVSFGTELFFPLAYNEEQKIIARQIDSNYGSVVQGPPGTGKTHTIANLISRFLAQGKTVLVTSQKGQALSVLKSKIPKEIRNMVVSQVEENSKDGDLQTAVKEINNNLSDTTCFTSEKKSKKENELGNKRREIAQKNNEFEKKSLLDSREEIVIGAERNTPISAAKYVFEFNNLNQFKIQDDLDYESSLNIDQSDIDKYLSILENSNPRTWDYYQLEKIPEVNSLPDLQIIERFFVMTEKLSQQDLDLPEQYLPTLSDLETLDNIKDYKENYDIHQRKAEEFKRIIKENIDIVTKETFDRITTELNEEAVLSMRDLLIKAKQQLVSFKESWEIELFEASKNSNQYQKWINILNSLDKKINEYNLSENILIGNIIVVDDKYKKDIISTLEIIKKIEDQAKENEGQIKKGLSLLFSPSTKQFLDSTKINGKRVLVLEELKSVSAYFLKIKLKSDILNIWSQSFKESNNFPEPNDSFSIINLETLVERIRLINSFINKNKNLSESILNLEFINNFDISELDSINVTLHILDNLNSYIKLNEYESIFYNIKKQFSGNNPHSCVTELRKAILNKDFDSILDIKAKLIKLNKRKEMSQEYYDLRAEVFSETVRSLQKINNNQELVSEFLLTLSNSKNIDEVIKFYKQIPNLIQEQTKAFELFLLETKISKFLPKTINLIKTKIKSNEPFVLDLEKNIKWKKFISWLDHLHEGDSVSKISKDLVILKNQEKDLVKDLIEIESWIHLKNRVTKPQKEALAAFALSMKSYGMGTGIHAPKHMKNARIALETGKEAVPVWVMPMNMVHQLFPNPKAGMFDVVIFDEASQADIRGLNIAYLGKKLLVVGDDEQVSPTSFTKQTVVTDLIARHMSDIPNSVHFSDTSSLFDIAKIKMTDIVTLTEHFRCIEELIGFSNNLSYSGRLKVLRDQLPKDRLDPVLEAVFVDAGYEETNGQVNKAEAEKIVERIQEMIIDSKYKDSIENNVARPTTFGVISLLGKEQSKYITKLISEKISAKEIEKREIICGDPYTFQGDERDIILLSMVKGTDQDNPNANISPYTVNKKENKQRINVAMSRARNKMILFHSISKDKLQNPDDLRKMIIDWFYNNKTLEKKAGLERIKEEVERGRASEFEYEVAEILINRGFKVIPQWEVAGFRIDLVVQGENSKIAIECDGDKYHNALEKWHEDIERQEILERSGWVFWRLSGSAFYRHREKALESLWLKLSELKIEPNL